MSENAVPLPVHSLMGRIIPSGADEAFGLPTESAKGAIAEAEVIVAVDVDSKREAIVYGRRLLEEIADSAESCTCSVFYVALDENSLELEWLCAAVKSIKGHHDYEESLR